MRHARPSDLDRIDGFLSQLRALGMLKEKSRGTFYRGSRAFLHFHEHEGELFADARLGEDFERCRANTVAERDRLLSRVQKVLSAGKASPDR